MEEALGRATAYSAPEEFEEQITELQLTKMYKSTEKRLTIAMASSQLSLVLRRSLRAAGFKVTAGRAPPGAIERALSAMLK